MARVRAVVVPVFLAHLALLAVFLVAAEPVRAAWLEEIESARAACVPFAHGPARLVEGGTIVAGRVARAPLSLLLVGPWPELIAPFVMPRCALRSPLPATFRPTHAESYLVMMLSVLAGTTFWSLASLATIRALTWRRRGQVAFRATAG